MARRRRAAVSTTFDIVDGVTTVRIAGTRGDVLMEIARISAETGSASWVRFLGPVMWGGDYIAHGEIHASMQGGKPRKL